MDLTALNTLGLPSRCKDWIVCQKISDLARLKNINDRDWHILGKGSNVVLPEHIDGLVIHVKLYGKKLLKEDQHAWYVTAYAGENWHNFVLWTLSQGYFGLENLALIPGSVGAAPIQNIGAYGVEVKDYLDHLYAYDLSTGKMEYFSLADCQLGYRDSFFKHKAARSLLITQLVFRLPKDPILKLDYPDIQATLTQFNLLPTPVHIAQAVTHIRQRKLPNPIELGNVGSFFKNPIVSQSEADQLIKLYPAMPCYPHFNGEVKLAAGWMIEYVGWKGKRLGPVGMYQNQSLVLVNYGGATATDVKALAKAVQSDVAARFGLILQPEPTFW